MLFCKICQKILVLKTDSGYIIKYCSRCHKTFDGDSEDTLIDSSFTDVSGYNTNTILKYAPYDRVNTLVKLECKQCNKRKYMT